MLFSRNRKKQGMIDRGDQRPAQSNFPKQTLRNDQSVHPSLQRVSVVCLSCGFSMIDRCMSGLGSTIRDTSHTNIPLTSFCGPNLSRESNLITRIKNEHGRKGAMSHSLNRQRAAQKSDDALSSVHRCGAPLHFSCFRFARKGHQMQGRRRLGAQKAACH